MKLDALLIFSGILMFATITSGQLFRQYPQRPHGICSPNEVYLECGPSCQIECSTLFQPCNIYHIRCPDGCYCRRGFARIVAGGPCVPINFCPYYRYG